MFRYRAPSILLLYGIFGDFFFTCHGRGGGGGGERWGRYDGAEDSRTELSLLCYCSDCPNCCLIPPQTNLVNHFSL